MASKIAWPLNTTTAHLSTYQTAGTAWVATMANLNSDDEDYLQPQKDSFTGVLRGEFVSHLVSCHVFLVVVFMIYFHKAMICM